MSQLFEALWTDYCKLNPAALRIYSALEKRGETVINDHIALRTFQHERLGIGQMARAFEALGYKRSEQEYIFTEKKLYAAHWEHPDENRPKVFISELELGKCSKTLEGQVKKLIDQIPDTLLKSPMFSVSGRPWTLSHKDYQTLAAESEYASWVAAYGFRANHFTVFFNKLKTFKTLPELNAFLKQQGHKLNSSGGEIKGTPAELLEQSSTLAEAAQVTFSDGTFPVPACYYEFARRYPQPNGKLYQGFIAKSADKIFESTNRKAN